MNNLFTSGSCFEPTTPARFAAPAPLPAKASMQLSLISVWLSTLEAAHGGNTVFKLPPAIGREGCSCETQL